MSVPNFNLCEVCGARTTERNRIFVATGVCRNGPETEPTGENIDLCETHAMKAVDKLVHKDEPNPLHYDHEQGKRLLKYIEWMKNQWSNQ